MLDSPGALQERIRQNGPRLLSIALGALIAVDLVRASASIFGSHAMSQPREAQPARIGKSPQIDAHKIAAAHLFGVFEDPGKAQQPRATTANLILAGTIATEDPDHGVAIISGDSAPMKVYRTGQEVNGALLRSVYLDHVLLDRNGTLEILALLKPIVRKGEAFHAPQALVAASTAADGPASDDAPPPEGSMQLTLSTVGGVRGFRVVGGKALEALRAAGLGVTDVVTAVNGAPLDQDSVRRSIDEAQGPLVVTVMRRGHPTQISVNLGD